MKISFDMPPATPDSSNDLSVRYAASRRHVPRWRWYLIVLAVLALPVYYGIQFIHDLLVVSAPGFVQMQQVTITAGTAGHVLFVLPSGATVKSGEALCRIQPYEQNDTIAASRSNRISKSALRSLQTALNLQARVVVIRQNKVKALKNFWMRVQLRQRTLLRLKSNFYPLNHRLINPKQLWSDWLRKLLSFHRSRRHPGHLLLDRLSVHLSIQANGCPMIPQY